jgi:hypothetical protein
MQAHAEITSTYLPSFTVRQTAASETPVAVVGTKPWDPRPLQDARKWEE